ncbi:MAG: peptidoglycan-binding protein [Marivirga sp.]|nr:peptidoglycan-binding protein [Marivirga sp.]
MGLRDKYKTVIDTATQGGAKDLVVEEKSNVLHITGRASEDLKQKIWDTYVKIDPDMRAGDLMLDIEAVDFEEVYVIKKGDTLGKIAKHYGTTWQKIHEMNKDTIKNPDLIFPGQKIKIPK